MRSGGEGYEALAVQGHREVALEGEICPSRPAEGEDDAIVSYALRIVFWTYLGWLFYGRWYGAVALGSMEALGIYGAIRFKQILYRRRVERRKNARPPEPEGSDGPHLPSEDDRGTQ